MKATLSLVALACLLVPVAVGGTSTIPALDHTAPFYGDLFTSFAVTGAPAGRRVVVFQSPSRGSTVTPAGVLELDRTSLTVMALGVTSATGEFHFDLFNVQDPSYAAEAETHYQALVADPTAPAGSVLSEAVHMRWMASRVYAGYRGRDDGPGPLQSGGLAIVSMIDDWVVADVPYGLVVPSDGVGDGEPVFQDDFARGAVMAGSTLVIFDPFFGDVLATLPFENPSRTLHTTLGRRYTVVLETGLGPVPELPRPARLHQVDLETAAVVATLELAGPVPGLWTVEDAGTRAYVAELDATSAHAALRRVRLHDLTDQGSFEVGTASSNAFRELTVGFGRIYVSTTSPDDGTAAHGELTTARDPFSGTPSVVVNPNVQWASQLTPVAAAGAVAGFELAPYIPSGSLFTMRPGNPNVRHNAGLPWVYLHVNAMKADGSQRAVWVLDASGNEPPGGTEPGRLYRLDLDRDVWTQYPTLWHMVGPVTMERLQDTFVDKIVLANSGIDPPISIDPELVVIDLTKAPATETSVPIGAEPEWLLAVPIEFTP